MISLAHLNPSQKQAATHINGPLLILAGAGSGKTSVITYRIANIISMHHVAPKDILAVTFTNKAAKEMQERVAKIIGKKGSEVNISTFHAFGLKFLKENISHLSYKKHFQIIDEADRLSIIKSALQFQHQDPEKFKPEVLLNYISLFKNQDTNLLMQWHNDYDIVFENVYKAYQDRLKINNLLDFDDLLLLPVKILESSPLILDQTRTKYHYLMVDEYQDTNSLQNRLLFLLAEKHKNICVVGDDDQSIYAWRGAEAGNILDFEKKWQGAQVITLEQNYRSTNIILNAANSVIKNNSLRKDKRLWSSLGEGEKITFNISVTDKEEAEYVANKINYFKETKAKKYRDFVILYRRNAQSRNFEEALRLNGIPYKLVGGFKFYDRREIKDLIAYLKFLVNPDDEIALERILNVPNRGIGAQSYQKIVAYAHHKQISVFKALKHVLHLSEMPKEKQLEIFQFAELLEKYLQLFHTKSIGDSLKQLIDELKYHFYLKKLSKTEEEYQSKLENVGEFVQSLYDFETRTKYSSLEKFLDRILLLEGNEDDPSEFNMVTLMSIHASKGLEFPIVFLVGMEEGIFPSPKSMQENNMDLSEERRLAYVAITRAKEFLFFTAVAERKFYRETKKCDISRFLLEIPEECYHIAPNAKNIAEKQEELKNDAAAKFFEKFKSNLE